jgi:hypothetical protein
MKHHYVIEWHEITRYEITTNLSEREMKNKINAFIANPNLMRKALTCDTNIKVGEIENDYDIILTTKTIKEEEE